MTVKNIELTKEYREAIAEFAAIDIENKVDYTPVGYRKLPKSMQAVFELRALDSIDFVDVSKTGEGNSEKTWGEKCVKICKNGIRNWHTYYTIDGKHVEYNEDLRGLSSSLLNELATEILTLNSLTKGEELGLK